MLAVHFGAGNIGRGFIGQLLYQAGYEVCFVDVNAEVIDELNAKNAYTVLLADDTQETLEIKNVWGINSIQSPEAVVEAISKADLVTTAVGPNILTRIAPLIAKGLINREESLNVIACENMIGGSEHLKKEIFNHLDAIQKDKIHRLIGFPNAAVDRIVPIQSHEDKLLVSVEPFFEWVIDKSGIKGNIPAIEGVTYVDNLLPYIERKLFTVNTGHAVTAYLGNYYGLPTIKEAINHNEVREIIKETLNETGELLVKKYNFDKGEHQKYIDKIITRFENEHISDEVDRVARSPIRKLGENDRLIKPARELMEYGVTPKNLSIGIAAALLYKNNADQEAKELNEYLQERTLPELLGKYTKLSEKSNLQRLIISSYDQLKKA